MKPSDAVYEGKLAIDNRDVAGVLERIADLLEFKDENPFKLRSYRVAAESIAEMSQPVAEIAARGAAALQELPGIGKSLSAQIIEIIETGTSSFFEELKEGKVRVSMRSKDEKVDVCAICQKFGGGGHKLAAGARVRGTLSEVNERVLEEICAALGNNS